MPSVIRGLLRTRSLLRGLVAILAICGVVLGVSACEVRPGAAAFVGDEKVSEADLEPYLLDGGPTQSVQADQPSARQYALTYLVRLDLYRDYLDRKGVDAGTTAFAAARAKVTQGQEAAIAQLPAQAAGLGLTTKFVDLLIDFSALQGLVSESTGSTDATEITTAVNQGAPKVKLSPRYGDWAADAQSVSPDTTTPDYLQLSGTSTGA